MTQTTPTQLRINSKLQFWEINPILFAECCLRGILVNIISSGSTSGIKLMDSIVWIISGVLNRYAL